MSNDTRVTVEFVNGAAAPGHGRRVVGFVHGMRGDPSKTWTNKDTHKYWPELVKNDPAFGRPDVFVAGYESGTKGAEPRLGDIVTGLRRELVENRGILGYDAISFVAHSLGGVLVRWLLCDDVLLHEKVLWNKTRLVMTFSAPYKGCDGAQLVGLGILDDSVQLEDVKPGSDMLARLDRKWQQVRAMGGRQPAIRCAWENPPGKGPWFMAEVSSTYCCDQAIEIKENHFNVVKPDGPDHASHQALRKAYREAFGESLPNP